MFRYNLPVEAIEPVQLGKYQCRYMFDIGTSKLYIANIMDEFEIDELEFKMVRVRHEDHFVGVLIPDMDEPNRKSFAFRFTHEGAVPVIIKQGLLAYRFNLDVDNGAVTIIGRAYPELYQTVDGEFAVTFKNEDKSMFIEKVAIDPDTKEHAVLTEDIRKHRFIKTKLLINSGDGERFTTRVPISKRCVVYIHPKHPVLAQMQRKNDTLADTMKSLFRDTISSEAAIIIEDDPEAIKDRLRHMEHYSDTKNRNIFLGYSYDVVSELRDLDQWIKTEV